MEMLTFRAAEQGNVVALKFLLENGVKLDRDAMYIAAEKGNVNILEYLRSIGHSFPDRLDHNALDNIDVLRYLNSIGHKFTEWSIERAASYGKLESVKYLLSIGCSYDKHIWTTGNIEILIYLHNQNLDHCPRHIFEYIKWNINKLALKAVKLVRLIPADIWGIIERMM